jgi:ribose transport system permease protein
MKSSWKIKKFIPYIGLIAILIIFTILTSGQIIRLRNIKLIFNQAIVLMIGCLGVCFVMTQGSLDLSQGSMLGFIVAISATVAAVNPALTLPAAIITGIIMGGINGALFAYFKIPSFIVTLCMLFILRGLTVIVTKSGSLPIPFSMYDLDTFGLKIVILLVVISATIYGFNFTRIGKYSKAIGAGERAARHSGVSVERMKLIVFIIAGVLCGICGFLNLIRTGAADSKTGLLFEIDILTALVVGGLPLTGGSNVRIQSAIIGALILSILTNGMILIGLKAELQQAVKGIIFLVAVYLSFERENVAIIK